MYWFRRRASRFTLTMVPALCLQACTTWVVHTGTPGQAVAEHAGRVLRVVQTNGVRSDLFTPVLHGDTLYGADAPASPRPDAKPPNLVVIPVANVHSIETPRISVERTAALVAGIVSVYLVVAVASSMATHRINVAGLKP